MPKICCSLTTAFILCRPALQQGSGGFETSSQGQQHPGHPAVAETLLGQPVRRTGGRRPHPCPTQPVRGRSGSDPGSHSPCTMQFFPSLFPTVGPRIATSIRYYSPVTSILPQADPAGFHSELQRLATCFFKPEAISWKEATSLAKRPRGGKGAAAFIRKRPASTPASGPVAKRPKTASSATGRLSCLCFSICCQYTASLSPFSLIRGPRPPGVSQKRLPSPWAPPAPKGHGKRELNLTSGTPGLWERRKIYKNPLPQVFGSHPRSLAI